MKNKLFLLIGALVVFSMVLSACQPAAPTAAPAPATEAPAATEAATEAPAATEAATEAPAATEAATEAPTEAPAATEAPASDRKGGWLDEIVVSVVDNPSVITQLNAGAIDVYVNGMASTQFTELTESGLPYTVSNGTYYTIQFNPAVFTDTNTLNPFSNRKIREAFNYLIDRNYINQEYYAGGALPKWFALMTNFTDYADLVDVARALEAKYAYNFDLAKEIIDTEMVAMGAEITDGKYTFNGEPVNVVFLIRSDGDGTRALWGEYLSAQMELVGFTVDRQLKTGSDAGPIWQETPPESGQWHMYTGGWGASVLDRDQANIFQEMYLNTSAQGLPVWLANESDPEFQELGDRLFNGDYQTVEERREMMARAMELSLQDSFQVMVADTKRFVPHVEGLVVTTDLAAGVESAQVTPYTLRFDGEEGGTVRWATQSFLFSSAWNPIAGSNTTSDQGAQRLSHSYDFMYDPYTGLVHPQNAEKAAVTMLENLPVQKTLDWVTLDTAAEIVVPEDAWADWDAAEQKFVTVGEASNGEEVTAKAKAVVTFRDDIYDRVVWHDGTKLDEADLLMGLIMTFDRAKADSAIYDKSAEGRFAVFMDTFKGVKIVSMDPLVVEWYTDSYGMDAELNAYTYTFWTQYSFGEGSWPMMAMMNKAEADGKLAYSNQKANEAEVEQTSTVGGPSLEILAETLDQLIADKTIPYESTLGEYLTADEAVARYEALKAFYEDKGHFQLGTGPYYIDSVDLTGKSLTLKHFEQFGDPADRWSNYAAPKLAEVEIEGPGQVVSGEAATFDVYVTYEGEAYPEEEIKQVKFLVYDATNTVVAVADAALAEAGHYTVELTPEQTTALGDGANKLEIAVVPFVVAQPTFESIEFVSAK